MDTRSPRKAAGLLALALMATTLAGCSDDPEFDAKVPNPCDALTTAQVEETLGIAYDDAKPNELLSTETQAICEWWATDKPGTFVQVIVKAGAGQVAVERESANQGLGATVDETVAGATEAYSMLQGAMIGMAVDDYFVQVSNLSGTGGDHTAETIALAEFVAANVSPS